jgi:hypothetical protein
MFARSLFGGFLEILLMEERCVGEVEMLGPCPPALHPVHLDSQCRKANSMLPEDDGQVFRVHTIRITTKREDDNSLGVFILSEWSRKEFDKGRPMVR